MITSAFFMPITLPPATPQVAKSMEGKSPKAAKPKVISVANQKSSVSKNTTVYNLRADLAMDGKKVMLLNVAPQSDLTKMLVGASPTTCP